MAVAFQKRQMLFNVDKSKVMQMGCNNTRPEYFLNWTKLDTVSDAKDLSDDLKWENNAVRQQPKQTKYLD